MTVTRPPSPDEHEVTAAAALDAADRAISAAQVHEAERIVDLLALRPLEPLDAARLRLLEGRIDEFAGRVRAAATALADAASAADRLVAEGTSAAVTVGDAARIEQIQTALRTGRVGLAATIAAHLSSSLGATAELVDASVRVGTGDASAIDGVDRQADALLVEQGLDAASFVAGTVGMALVWAERYDEAERLLGRLTRSARAEGVLGPLPTLLAVQALADLRSNRYRAAAARADEAVRLADGSHRPGLTGLPIAVLAVAEAIRSDASACRRAAARLADQTARAGRSGGELASEVPARAALGLLHLGLDEPELAVAQLEPLHGRSGTTPWIVMWQMDYAEALVRVGRVGDAEAVVAAFTAGLDASRPGRAAAAADRVLALARADRPREAEALLARSELLLREVASPFGVGRTLLARGTLRRRWGREADGMADLTHAEALLRSIGAEGWAAQVEAQLGAPASAAGMVATPIVPPSPLTAQEVQVAGLVATGRSNREVADTLFISVRTVESHLGRIFRKLELRSRSQLIARAGEWGLRDQTAW